MSAALFLNPNLTTEQAISLSKLQTESVGRLVDHFSESVERIRKECGQKAATDFFNQMYPLILQQTLMCF